VAIALYFHSQAAIDENFFWILVGAGAVFFMMGWRAVKNPLAAIRYRLNPRATVRRLINEWSPQQCRLESQYEKSLHSFLQERLPFVKVTRQYGSARIKCDIAISNDVIVELKAGFSSTQKLQRLIGQIDLFKQEWREPVIVVLLGGTQHDLLHDLHNSIRRHSYIVDVVTKETNAVAEGEDS